MSIPKPLLIGGGAAALALTAWALLGKKEQPIAPPPFPHAPPQGYYPQPPPQGYYPQPPPRPPAYRDPEAQFLQEFIARQGVDPRPPAYRDPEAQIAKEALLETYFGNILPFETLALEEKKTGGQNIQYADVIIQQPSISSLMIPVHIQKQQVAAQQALQFNRWAVVELTWAKSFMAMLRRSGLFENETFLTMARSADLTRDKINGTLQAIGAGSAIGAKAGSFIPIIGTTIGSAIGAVGGALLGLVNAITAGQRENEVRRMILEIFGQAMLDIGAPPIRIALLASAARREANLRGNTHPDPFLMLKTVVDFCQKELFVAGKHIFERMPELPAYDEKGQPLTIRGLCNMLFDPRDRLVGRWPLLEAPIFDALVYRDMLGCTGGQPYTTQEDARIAMESSLRIAEAIKLDLGYLWPEILPMIDKSGFLMPNTPSNNLPDVLVFNNREQGAYVTSEKAGGSGSGAGVYMEQEIQARLAEITCIGFFRLEVASVRRLGE